MRAIPNRFKHCVYKGFFDGIVSRYSGEAGDPYWRLLPENSLQGWRAGKAGYLKNNAEKRAYVTGFNAALSADAAQVNFFRESTEESFLLHLIEIGLVAPYAE